MAINKEKKKKVIEAFQAGATDTGSAAVQVGLLTEDIRLLTEHLKKHAKDFSSKRGLLSKVSRRRSFLQYLARTNPRKHSQVLEQLGLKK